MFSKSLQKILSLEKRVMIPMVKKCGGQAAVNEGGQRRFAEKKHGGAWSQEGGRECRRLAPFT